MDSFSNHMGITNKADVQLEVLNERTKNRIWDALGLFWEQASKLSGGNSAASKGLEYLCRNLWHDFFASTLDDMPKLKYYFDDALRSIKNKYFHFEWYEIYNFLEFVVRYYKIDYKFEETNKGFMDFCNNIFDEENVGYRFVDCKIVPIIEKVEIEEIERAVIHPIFGVKEHLKTALDFLTPAKKDPRNSIKEAISAVENICKKISSDSNADLSKALRTIENEGKINIHPALKAGFDKIYGYTSNEGGIRHALLEERKLDTEDARFMIVACSAFINYLVEKANKAGISLGVM